MTGRLTEFLFDCKTMDFGKGKLSKKESSFYRRFSKEIVSLCKALPMSAQTDAMLFLVQYSGAIASDDLDFFARYYPPSWSILYWLSRDQTLRRGRLKEEDVTNAVAAQSMAMFLHSLDDHLSDGQVSVSPLTLLLRSQAWAIMNRAFDDLAEGIPDGVGKLRSFIDDYYWSIQNSKTATSLESYCELFKKQMSIGMIAPVLLSLKMAGMSDFTRDIEIAYGSFGIAWRLLDDVQDIADDIEKGSHSALYYCLPKKVRTSWNDHTKTSPATTKDSTNAILNHILETGLIKKIKERMCSELEKAARIVEAHAITGLAQEFRCLADPLKNRGDT